MDSIVHIENDKFIGRTNFKSGLLNNVVALSVKEIAGVDRIIEKGNGRNGVKITNAKDNIVIDVNIWTSYGYSSADVCYRVQENVINAAASMIDKKVKAVNIKILNVGVPYFEGIRA